jgi:hypothetical protein
VVREVNIKTYNIRKRLGPFDYGPRPEGLVGKTNMTAERMDDEDTSMIYLGER